MIVSPSLGATAGRPAAARPNRRRKSAFICNTTRRNLVFPARFSGLSSLVAALRSKPNQSGSGRRAPKTRESGAAWIRHLFERKKQNHRWGNDRTRLRCELRRAGLAPRVRIGDGKSVFIWVHLWFCSFEKGGRSQTSHYRSLVAAEAALSSCGLFFSHLRYFEASGIFLKRSSALFLQSPPDAGSVGCT